jgi:putative ABC transport system substrate-binding protein
LSVASGATRTIPIVIAALNYDPVQKGYVKSLAQPGRNITGIHYRNPEVGAKQVELLQAVLPSASRVGLLWTRYSVDQVPPVETAASRLSLRLDKIELASKSEIPAAFAALKARRVDAAIALGDPVVYGNRARVAEAALAQRLPLFGQLSLAEAGGLLGFGPDLIAALRRAAEYVDRILRGAAPGNNADRADGEVRASRQSEDGEDARRYGTAVGAAAGGRRHSVAAMSAFCRSARFG